jgi:hypothetical protein
MRHAARYPRPVERDIVERREARARFLREWPCLSAEEAADVLVIRGGWRLKDITRRAQRRELLRVRDGRRDLFPAFQFDKAGARVWPGLNAVLAALAQAGVSGWQAAFWFTEPNPALAQALQGDDPSIDTRPIDWLDHFPNEVVAAAGDEAKLPGSTT